MSGLIPFGTGAPHLPRPQRKLAVSNIETSLAEVQNDSDKFAIKMDVGHFTPEEIKVKVEEGGLIITGNHEEKMDEHCDTVDRHGSVFKSFQKHFLLPKDVDTSTMTFKLSENGVLYVEAPKSASSEPM